MEKKIFINYGALNKSEHRLGHVPAGVGGGRPGIGCSAMGGPNLPDAGETTRPDDSCYTLNVQHKSVFDTTKISSRSLSSKAKKIPSCHCSNLLGGNNHVGSLLGSKVARLVPATSCQYIP